MLPEIKVWVDASTKWKMTERQELYLIEFYVPQTRIVPVSKEPRNDLLTECTDCYSFVPNYNLLENMSFNSSLLVFRQKE